MHFFIESSINAIIYIGKHFWIDTLYLVFILLINLLELNFIAY